jgi:2-succinyl-5-enolpyruvyl-6-hydroxy-3-cyclohexene-1-carboxylate synthase
MTRPRTESPATDFAVALLEEFVRLGVRDIVVSPGSRSQALALAAADLERRGLVRLRVRIDERVAGFLALGIAAETAAPVIIITTSGTAVANLHPAVLEAHHSGVPLVVVTGDRPAELRGIGSNQTTDQPGIFGSAVQRTWDVGAPTGEPGEPEAAVTLARAAIAGVSGPIHLNLAFTEPLSASIGPDDEVETPAASRPVEAGHRMHVTADSATVVIAGTGAGARAEEVARELGAPLIAEVASGAHFGPNLVVAYRELLNNPDLAGTVRRAIVFGHPTLSREIPALLQREDVEVIVVRGGSPEDYNPGRRASAFVDGVTIDGDPAPRAWAGSWVSASRELTGSEDVAPDIAADAGAHARAELAAVRAPVTRRALVEAVWRATWPHDRLVLGASRLIRELDRVAAGKKVTVHANRGLAGIDGTIATGVGIALSSQLGSEPGTTRVLLGDLALLHDVGALAFGVGEVRPRVQVIVGNDGGGTIFDGLEVASSAGDAFDRVLLTPQTVALDHLAAAYGWEYRRVDTRGQLDQALTASIGPTLVEVPLSR